MTSDGSGVEGDTSIGGDQLSMSEEQSRGEAITMSSLSGLSALIQAATSHLGQLADIAATATSIDGEHELRMTGSDELSGELDETENPTTTPTLVPLPDPSKQSFPELLMTLAMDPQNINTITFLPDGKFFALRVNTFVDDDLVDYFSVSSFEEFLSLTRGWGFTRILQDTKSTGIEVFRHPLFTRGDWEKCASIQYGELSDDRRLSGTPVRERMEHSGSDSTTGISVSKRRLSPSFLARRESETSHTSKPKIDLGERGCCGTSVETESKLEIPDMDSSRGNADASYSGRSRSDDIRSTALAITAEKLNLRSEGSDDRSSPGTQSLIAEAVESTTHTIVTDAIETLLRDESHTVEIYRRHEKELSKSTLPGVIPISKQLFSSAATAERPPEEVTTDRAAPSPPTLEVSDGPSSLDHSPDTSPKALTHKVVKVAADDLAN